MHPVPKKFRHVYPYLRFSSDPQGEGNSIERQREALRKGVLDRLDGLALEQVEITWLEDHGLSAYHGHHLSKGAMGDFMQKVKSRQVEPDSLFVCESVSRASRQGGFAVLGMINAMLDAEMCVLLLDQGVVFNRSEIPKFLTVQLTLYAELAREESLIKSQYAKDNWSRNRQLAREKAGDFVFTRECPRWLEVHDGKYRVIEEKATSVREIYAKALDGFGIHKLVSHANTNRLPVPGKGDSWHASLVKRLLENRAVIGEFQPHVNGPDGTRVPEGDPIDNFYPAIVDLDVFHAVNSLRQKRHEFPKRADANNHNYLLGLGRCACGGSWRWLNKHSEKQLGYSQYSCSNRERSFSECPKVNGRHFDHAFIAWALDRIPEMLATGDDPRRARVLSVEAQLESIRTARARLQGLVEMADADIARDILPRLRQLKDEEVALEAELLALQRDAAPEGFTFDEAVEVFLPAFLDYWPENSPEAEDAYRVRSLFKSRVAQAVARVEVSRDRTEVTVTLKNDKVEVFELGTSQDGMYGPPDLDSDEFAALDGWRKNHLQRSRQIGNHGVVAPDASAPD